MIDDCLFDSLDTHVIRNLARRDKFHLMCRWYGNHNDIHIPFHLVFRSVDPLTDYRTVVYSHMVIETVCLYVYQCSGIMYRLELSCNGYGIFGVHLVNID